MAIMHHLQSNGWQLVTTSFANNTDGDGSYMVHKHRTVFSACTNTGGKLLSVGQTKYLPNTIMPSTFVLFEYTNVERLSTIHLIVRLQV